MRLAASNIGWAAEDNAQMAGLLAAHGFTGIEVAPTIIAGENPYDKPERAAEFAAEMARCGLAVCSLQSIWYGQSGSIFGPEAPALEAYTQKAIHFAVAAGAANLVFGCPKNRVRPEGMSEDAALPFLRRVGGYAARHGVVFSLEANPEMYGTNFMNTTAEALDMVRKAASPGVMLNLDFGTILANGEPIGNWEGDPPHIPPYPPIHHVHISEPGLAPVQPRDAHRALADLLRASGYNGYVSIEMQKSPLSEWRRVLPYIAEVFS